jgi:hypothetical protein
VTSRAKFGSGLGCRQVPIGPIVGYLPPSAVGTASRRRFVSAGLARQGAGWESECRGLWLEPGRKGREEGRAVLRNLLSPFRALPVCDTDEGCSELSVLYSRREN